MLQGTGKYKNLLQNDVLTINFSLRHRKGLQLLLVKKYEVDKSAFIALHNSNRPSVTNSVCIDVLRFIYLATDVLGNKLIPDFF
jgi:hypothetical protein